MALLPRPSSPAVINVGGSCTLVAAITAANNDNTAGGLCPTGSGSDEIRLFADVTLTQVDNTVAGDAGTTAGPNGLPVVETVILIEGNGHSVARGAGAPAFRIISVDFPGNLTLQNITLTNGGGATFDYLGGAISTNATGVILSVSDSTIADNSAGGFSGGGGGIYNGSNHATLTGTTISGNSAYIGGGLLNSGVATITNSTLSGNVGGEDKGGAIDNTGTVTLKNSTFSGNSAGATGAGAINVFSGEARLENTLLGHSSPVNCKTGSGSVVDNSGNLADDDSCGMTIPDTLSDLDRDLADNGGPTRTHALFVGSDAIGLAKTCGLDSDQRGAVRPGGACDSGAYEFVPCPDLVLDLVEFGEVTHENCQRIVTVPNFSVTGTGNVTLRAGSAVILGNGTEVDSGGQLEIEIDPDLQLVPPS